MSLQVWLPLNGNISNQGVASVTVTNNGATSNNNGKIGKCCYFNGSSWIKISLPTGMTSIKNTTVAMWVKGNTAFGGISHDGDTTSGACITFYDKYWQVVGDGTYLASGKGKYDSVGADNWHHIACAISDTDLLMYFDGALVSTASISANKIKTDLPAGAFIEIGADHPGGDEFLTGYVNDFRVYDHCLSTREVKELSKGLVCHYPLNQPERSQNLIANSTTVIGGGNAAGITSELMSDGSLKIVATSGNNNYRSCRFADSTITDNNIEKYLSAGTTYTISLDIKVEEGTKFPTLFLNNNYNPLVGGDPTKHGVWQRVYQTMKYVGKTTNYNYMSLHFGFSNAIGTYYVKNFKLEVGTNTNPKWSPAITDAGNWGLIEYDTSGLKNNSIVELSTQPTWSPDTSRYAGCYHFTNTQYIKNTSLSFKSLTSTSISFWLKVNTVANLGCVLFSGQSDSEYIMATKNGSLPFYNSNVGSGTISYYEDGIKVTTPKNDGSWHHYVVTGVDLSSWTEFDINSYNSSWNIDCYYSDIRLYNTILTVDDVRELYNSPFSVTNMGGLLIQGEVNES